MPRSDARSRAGTRTNTQAAFLTETGSIRLFLELLLKYGRIRKGLIVHLTRLLDALCDCHGSENIALQDPAVRARPNLRRGTECMELHVHSISRRQDAERALNQVPQRVSFLTIRQRRQLDWRTAKEIH